MSRTVHADCPSAMLLPPAEDLAVLRTRLETFFLARRAEARQPSPRNLPPPANKDRMMARDLLVQHLGCQRN